MARKHRKLSPGDRRAGRARTMKIVVHINRQSTTAGEYTRKYAFQACIKSLGKGNECGYGANPRKALANAMASSAKRLRKRGGAFRGFKSR